MAIKQLASFPAEDGHIESILVGAGAAKVSFQTWDRRQLVLIFKETGEIKIDDAAYEGIGQYQQLELADGKKQYCFFSSWEFHKMILCINAGAMEIFETGQNGGLNTALFDVGYEYIGNQDAADFYR